MAWVLNLSLNRHGPTVSTGHLSRKNVKKEKYLSQNIYVEKYVTCIII